MRVGKIFLLLTMTLFSLFLPLQEIQRKTRFITLDFILVVRFQCGQSLDVHMPLTLLCISMLVQLVILSVRILKRKLFISSW